MPPFDKTFLSHALVLFLAACLSTNAAVAHFAVLGWVFALFLMGILTLSSKEHDRIVECLRLCYQGLDEDLKPLMEKVAIEKGWNPAAVLDPNLKNR